MWCGRNVVIYVDNIAVVYGWAKGLVKKDRTASKVLKAVSTCPDFWGLHYTWNMYPGCRICWRQWQMNCQERTGTSVEELTEF